MFVTVGTGDNVLVAERTGVIVLEATTDGIEGEPVLEQATVISKTTRKSR
jgi:hypothetical protein